MARALRAGTVHVNQYDEDDITVPFGGYKQSGNGRDKSLHAFDKYTETEDHLDAHRQSGLNPLNFQASNAMPQIDPIQAAIDDLSAQGIHSILTQFCDLHGVAKGKLVPLDDLTEWVENGAGFAGPSIWGTGLGRYGARSEYYGRVQIESLRPLPWMPGVAHAVCDGYAGGEPLASCSRQLLKHQLSRLKARGWTLWVGIEPEFFLLRQDQNGQWLGADAQDGLDKPSYDLKAIHRNHAFLDDMRQTLTALGFRLQQIDHEDARGQYEINYRFHSALEAADHFMLFKMAAHVVAQEHGCVFSCMPKPLCRACRAAACTST